MVLLANWLEGKRILGHRLFPLPEEFNAQKEEGSKVKRRAMMTIIIGHDFGGVLSWKQT